MQKPDSPESSRWYTLQPIPEFQTKITPCHLAFCGLHQSDEMPDLQSWSGSLETESFGKKFGDVRLLGSSGALKENCCIRPEFVNHLPACPAWRTCDTVIIRHRDGLNLNLRAQFSHGRENRSPLGAVRHSIRSIFYVTSGKDSAIGKKNRRADVKVGIWRVGILHDFLRCLFQLASHA